MDLRCDGPLSGIADSQRTKVDALHGFGVETNPMSRSLVTFALFAYNQERFIREAVRGALAQTYSPLQLILSDDCSHDKTFEIMQEEATGYEGPHKIILNRNSRNLGLGGHVNRLIELAEGDLIVAAAGDDISLPIRTEELTKVWSHGGVAAVYSSVIVTDENGTPKATDRRKVAGTTADRHWQELIRRSHGVVLGASQAWDRTVFETFGPLPESLGAEDYALEFRAALLGKIAHVDKPLVRYRRHGSAIMGDDRVVADVAQFARDRAALAQRLSAAYSSWLRDIPVFLSIRPEMENELLPATEVIAAKMELNSFKATALEKGRRDRLRSAARVVRNAAKLGTKPVAQTCLLGASPLMYYRVQRRAYTIRNALKAVLAGYYAPSEMSPFRNRIAVSAVRRNGAKGTND